MADYRLYGLDNSGKFSFAEWIKAYDDSDAVQQVRILQNTARKCEVWQGNRLVASFDASDLTIAPRKRSLSHIARRPFTL